MSCNVDCCCVRFVVCRCCLPLFLVLVMMLTLVLLLRSGTIKIDPTYCIRMPIISKSNIELWTMIKAKLRFDIFFIFSLVRLSTMPRAEGP